MTESVWQPIASAPKDGTRIWARDSRGRLFVVKCQDPGGRYERWVNDDGTPMRYLTHWQPLPEPPKD